MNAYFALGAPVGLVTLAAGCSSIGGGRDNMGLKHDGPSAPVALSPRDVVEIHNVAAMYGHVLDREDWGALDGVFAPNGAYDGSWTGSTRHEGLDAVKQYLAHPHRAVHHTTNVCLDACSVDGLVRGTAKWLVVHHDLRVASGDYRDLWIRTAEGWRLQERTSYRLIPAPEVEGSPSDRAAVPRPPLIEWPESC